MVEATTRKRVKALLDAVRARPTELPFDEIVDLSRGDVSVEIDRSGDEPVVYVSARQDPRFTGLSEREYEVAQLVAAGFSNAQIADALFISVATVKDHVHAILTKTGLVSRSEVAACWYGHL